MSIMNHWQEQRDSLRTCLTGNISASDAVRHVRHTLLQIEQNALAEMDDDLLRQQASVLMGSLKGALGLLEAHGTAQVWMTQESRESGKNSRTLWRSAIAALSILAVYCILNADWFAAAAAIAAFGFGIGAFLQERKRTSAALTNQNIHTSVTVDTDQLLGILDSQLRSMDRYLNDFSYLNEQARGASETADPLALSRAADLMEALYDCDENERAPVEEAARRLLEKLGLQALDYCEEHSRLFNALPSKSITRTLSPAIVSIRDQQLLRRGTAAVRISAA